jgi:two-component system chemotaxis response regulator CheY
MRRVLVVDDSALIHAVCTQVLGRLKEVALTFARTGQEALDHLAQHGEPDVILLDVNMPVMDGLECLARLTAAGVHERVPVVIVSTEGSADDVQRGLDLGARRYLRKPLNFVELRRIVEELLAERA